MSTWLDRICGWVWGVPLLVLLVGTGVFLTFQLRGIQFRGLLRGLCIAFGRSSEGGAGELTHFQSLMTALAATIGNGNIVGVATAMAVGGPGALFWMWMAAVFGMATKYAEALLAVEYRIVDERGEMSGGPMYYLARGLNQPWMGVFFAVAGACAAFGIGNMVQANAVAVALHETARIPMWVSGSVMCVLTGVVLLGGVRRIGHVSSWLVPWMALIYIAGSAVILIRYADRIPGALLMIFHDAFTGTAAAGGFAGATMLMAAQRGISRGLFSNEAGMGSAPIAAAAARTPHPVPQALVSMTGTFLDTIVVCTCTGLVLLVTGVWSGGLEGPVIARTGFEQGLPGAWGGIVVTMGITLFAYSTIIGWAYYGEKCIEYLFGVRAIFPYRVVWTVAVLVGTRLKLATVWTISDIMNGLMALPNLAGLLLLSGVAARRTREYFERSS
ncbi:MAG: sodium:alanine symporter family protein [Kiritimatiellae bacterium]|nr:sodium:alanine symporter family protein [Kiritimatiellia bacterium]